AILPIAATLMTIALPIFPITPVAQAQERTMRTLSVTGRGVETLQTTLTQVRLGVEAQGKTAGEVQAIVAQRSTSVVNFLKGRNVEKLETTGINLSPIYRYDNGSQTLTGYSASNMVSFRTATNRAGDLMDEAVKAGASRIDGISFSATEEAIAAAQKLALAKATKDAQAQAQAVLSALNFTPKEIVGIQINGAATPPPRPMMEANFKAMRSADATTPVMGGEQQVDATVTLQISY
ncbi:MAG: SIMPL domain-containing protein, partial [Synechococcales bacterium]|nr:SIMPL domain-containing protein [Synechococcales bacterium]